MTVWKTRSSYIWRPACGAANSVGQVGLGTGEKMICVRPETRIENPREYGPGAVEHLRQLLEGGYPAQQDPRRENFYEIEGRNETYYIHHSPISGNIVLVAKWIRQSQECCLNSGHLVA